MLELALVLALDEIQKLETFEKIDTAIVVRDDEKRKIIPTPIVKDISTITPKSGRKDHSKFIKDDGIGKLGHSGKFSRLFKSMPLTRKIDVFSFSIFNLLYCIINIIYWTHIL